MRVTPVIAMLALALVACGQSGTSDPNPQPTSPPDETVDSSNSGPSETTSTTGVPDPLPGSTGICARIDLASISVLFDEPLESAYTEDFGVSQGTVCGWESATEALDITFWAEPNHFADFVEGDELGLYTPTDLLSFPAFDNGLSGVAFLAPNGWTIEITPVLLSPTAEEFQQLADAAVAATG